jgi:c-di-GMP-binding flagellar brake protein YcgR
MPSKEKDLDPVTDLKMVQRYLQYGVEFRELVSCRLEDTDATFDAYVVSVDVKSLSIDMEITEESFAKLTPAALDQGQTHIRLSYSVNEATFFVHGKIQRRMTRRLVVQADMPMYKLQRREALRIKVTDSHGATVRLGRDSFPVFDISAGGLSIVIPLSGEKNFKKGLTFPKSTLNFLGKTFQVDLETKNLLTHGKDGLKVKVGFHFVGLPAAVEQIIAREAYLHTHKIWSRWL